MTAAAAAVRTSSATGAAAAAAAAFDLVLSDVAADKCVTLFVEVRFSLNDIYHGICLALETVSRLCNEVDQYRRYESYKTAGIRYAPPQSRRFAV